MGCGEISRVEGPRKPPPSGLLPFGFFQLTINPKLDPPDSKQIELGFGLARDDPVPDTELPFPDARSDRRHGVFDTLVDHMEIPLRLSTASNRTSHLKLELLQPLTIPSPRRARPKSAPSHRVQPHGRDRIPLPNSLADPVSATHKKALRRASGVWSLGGAGLFPESCNIPGKNVVGGDMEKVQRARDKFAGDEHAEGGARGYLLAWTAVRDVRGAGFLFLPRWIRLPRRKMGSRRRVRPDGLRQP
jgi:hypothetical protein